LRFRRSGVQINPCVLRIGVVVVVGYGEGEELLPFFLCHGQSHIGVCSAHEIEQRLTPSGYHSQKKHYCNLSGDNQRDEPTPTRTENLHTFIIHSGRVFVAYFLYAEKKAGE